MNKHLQDTLIGCLVAEQLETHRTLQKTADSLGISRQIARTRFHRLLRILRHPDRLGEKVAGSWRDRLKQEPGFFIEAAKLLRQEIANESREQP